MPHNRPTDCDGLSEEEVGSAAVGDSAATVEATAGDRVDREDTDGGVAAAGMSRDNYDLARPFAETVGHEQEKGEGGTGGQDDVAGELRRTEMEKRQVLMIWARDIKVEFPYVATACTGDMEHDDVLRWLQRFRSVALPQTRNEVNIHAPRGVPKRRATTVRQTPDMVSPELRRPGLIKRPAVWSCQFVEAKKFGLSAVLPDADLASGGGGAKMAPDLCCSVSDVSVSTATYAAKSSNANLRRDSRGGGGGLQPVVGLSDIWRFPPVLQSAVGGAAGALSSGSDRSGMGTVTGAEQRLLLQHPIRRRQPLGELRSTTKASQLPSEERLDRTWFANNKSCNRKDRVRAEGLHDRARGGCSDFGRKGPCPEKPAEADVTTRGTRFAVAVGVTRHCPRSRRR